MSRLIKFFTSSHSRDLLRLAANMADSICLDENATIESLQAAREFRDYLNQQSSRNRARTSANTDRALTGPTTLPFAEQS